MRTILVALLLGLASLPAAAAPAPKVIAVAAGGAHTCLLEATGRVLCWGRNVEGQLGDGTTTSRALPSPVARLPAAAEIAAGARHTCARLASGKVLCWGQGAQGQLGDGKTTGARVPVAVTGLDDAVALFAGDMRTCARRRSGRVACWGAADSAVPKDLRSLEPPVADVQIPAAVEAPAQLAIGAFGETCVVAQGGTLSCGHALGDAPPVSDAVSVAISRAPFSTQTGACDDHGCRSEEVMNAHACAVRKTGDVVCWGAQPSLQAPVDLHDAVEVAVTGVSSCARRATGAVVCWGRNVFGLLGAGDRLDRTGHAVVPGLTGVVALSAGAGHVCAREASGRVMCWGDNTEGQIGDGSSPGAAAERALPVAGPLDLVSLSQRGSFGCAVRGTGRAGCWGANQYGQAGTGTTSGPASRTPFEEIAGVADATAVSTGTDHACLLRRSGRVACWGYNKYGQLGNDSTVDAAAPVEVQGIGDALAVIVEGYKSCALRKGGRVSCWGEIRELLRAKTVEYPRPVDLPWVAGATAIALGNDHLCALSAAGQVTCWGSTWPSGVFGCGDEHCGAEQPVPVKDLRDAVQISAVASSTCALRRGGTVVCWGPNLHLDGALNPQLAPLAVPLVSGVKAISGECALRADGTVWCWGAAALPQGARQPAAIPGIKSATALAESELRCALIHGAAWCWDAESEVLGDSPASKALPTEVRRP